MKNIVNLIVLIACLPLTAQVLFTGTEPQSESVLLEFKDNSGGIVLPWVDRASAVHSSEGALIFDTEDRKIKLYNGTEWISLSRVGINNNQKLDDQNSLSENIATTMVLGTTSTETEGVLVLESSDKALVLPRMDNPAVNLKSPEPGTMLYDTSKKMIALYNGSEWVYLGH